MPQSLPPPIADYLDANARLDLEGMLAPFRADAVFIDNGKRFEGLAAIRHLFEEEVIKVKAVFTPDSLRAEGDDVVLEGPTRGHFPGSPLRFTYRFKLAHGAIERLETTF